MQLFLFNNWQKSFEQKASFVKKNVLNISEFVSFLIFSIAEFNFVEENLSSLHEILIKKEYFTSSFSNGLFFYLKRLHFSFFKYACSGNTFASSPCKLFLCDNLTCKWSNNILMLMLSRYVSTYRVIACKCSRTERTWYTNALMTLSNVSS